MGKITGFIEIARAGAVRRPVTDRLQDWREVYEPIAPDDVRQQGARCMDCSIPFCHQGCPLGNLIPDWNDLAYKNRWRHAIDRLHATNNFPEFTGRLCPAPCESSCVLGINADPVSIKMIEQAIIDRAFEEGWISAERSDLRTGKHVAVVGSGPAGLAAAEQLARAGHDVTVFERSDRIGGLLRYGIPEFKMEKRVLDRRLALIEQQGVTFRAGVNVGVDISARQLRDDFDAVLLAGGAGQPRDLRVPGRELGGVHFAMDFLTQQNRLCAGDAIDPATMISAAGKRVAIIGGGDTGADCLGTVLRQGAVSVHQLELMPRPPAARATGNPWPEWPHVFRVSSAHEEGGERAFAVMTEHLSGTADGHVAALHAREVEVITEEGRASMRPVEGSEVVLPVDLVLLAMGFTGAEPGGILESLGVRMTERGTVWSSETWMTNVPGVFAAGDIQRGQSLIVWAIAEGRSAARGIDEFLMGTSELPAPVERAAVRS